MYTNVRISDSVATNEAYAKRAVELGQTILSTCEHSWQGNYWECYKLAKQYGLKMLFASEAYWVKDRLEKDSTNCHIFLGAKNEHGRQCLNDILSEANLTGFYGRPRVDIPLLLSLPKDDVWVTSACLAGWWYEDAEDIWTTLFDHFGKNFFLEVQYHDTDKQREINERVLKLHNQIKAPLIMGCDSHFIFPQEDQNRIDFINSKGMHYADEDNWYMDMPDGNTAYERFAKQGVLTHTDIMDAINNTQVFCDVEEYDSPIFNSDIKMPTLYPDWTQEQRDEEYKRLVWSGWDAYKTDIPREKWPHYEDEIKSEVQTVVDTHMADYFIDNYHIIRKGKENGGWLTKTGRGSAVSFITNKLLGFTEVDRIAASVKMYPERFMSATRILASGSLPDIDFNVADQEPFARAQQEVLGEDHAYPMVAYGTAKVSAAWKLYAKSQGVPFELANTVSDQIKRYEMAVKHQDEDDDTEIDPFDYIDEQYREIFSKSKDYLGLITSWSVAPCSYLLYQGSIRREIGLVRVKDHLCCCMDGHWAEECHFLKNDLLTVQVVNLIYQAFRRIGREPPNVNELLSWTSGDQTTWNMYDKGCTLCLNQVEREGTSARVRVYKPSNISELCAFVAAIRPGFKSMYKIFEARSPFAYGVKAFDELIQTEEMPNSFILYQEQEMAALHYAGIPMSECYTAVKNIAKKRKEKVLAYEEKFKSGLVRTMIEDEHRSQEDADTMAAQLWQIITDASSYSFNASHSYCVALDSLYEAWLKSHHPLEFYEVALNIYEKKGNKDKMNALKEEAENYFMIHFAPIRYGQDNRGIKAVTDENIITNSIASIKGFSKSLGATLYTCSQQPHKSFIDILRWLDAHSVKSAKVEPLIKIDYFQKFGNNAELLRLVDIMEFFKYGSAKTIRKEKLNSQMASFIAAHGTDKGAKGAELKSYTITDMDGLLNDLEDYIMGLHLPELPFRTRAKNQKDILGYVDLTTHLEADRRKIYVLDVRPLKSKFSGKTWSYAANVKSIGTGKTSRLFIKPFVFDKAQFAEGDVLYAKNLQKDQKEYWWLQSYDIVPE
nr:MAG TPA: DNA polymerase III, alpha subunit [Caudoviricetes sp.]